MMMDNLIKTINRIQDTFATANIHNPIDLPQIVVIGSQSSGKSSVLENIVGRDFLPRGSGIVTRRPLVLQLINNRPSGLPKDPSGDFEGDEESGKVKNGTSSTQGSAVSSPAVAKKQMTLGNKSEEGGEEWGEFVHLPNKKFYNFEEIREEIIRDTDLKTGHTKGVSPIPINLRIFSPTVVTLTLVDLPGLTKVPVGDQPKDIEKQIRDMIVKYISKNNAIVLAVTAANSDLANSDGLKMAREVDPEGVRTLGVLTKIDLMDAGTDVVEILSGRIIPLKLGYVPVVNRGQKDIDGRKSITAALDAERRFFEGHPAYQGRAQYCGTTFLTRRLSTTLMNHIKDTLPEMKLKVTALLQKYEVELRSLGDNLADNNQNLILSVITEFCNDYRTFLDGQSSDISTTELNGGARISFVFHEIFANAINAMDPFDQIKDVDIRTLLYNSSGSTPALFVAAAGFETLIKAQIRRLEDPALKCSGLIFDELNRILTQLLQKPIFRRFPMLKERFYGCVMNFYKKCLEPANKFITNLVAAEGCYINTAHPDFLSGHRALAIVTEQLQANQKPAQQVPNPNDKNADPRRALPPPPHAAAQPINPTALYPVENDASLFGSFLNKKPIKKPGVLETPPAVLRATGSLSEREYVEIEIIKLLLKSYFNIVKRTVVDMIPKGIMLHLVNFTKEEMQRALLADMYKPDLLDELLKESDSVVARRKEVRRMIEALVRVDDIISTI